jgi:hypothetical protein
MKDRSSLQNSDFSLKLTSGSALMPGDAEPRTLRLVPARCPFRQAALVLRWFRERGCVHWLARDAGISQATGYSYLHEGINVLAAQAGDLQAVLDCCLQRGMSHMILDGTLIMTDRLAGTTLSVKGRPDRCHARLPS